jgi:hypothetical protein
MEQKQLQNQHLQEKLLAMERKLEALMPGTIPTVGDNTALGSRARSPAQADDDSNKRPNQGGTPMRGVELHSSPSHHEAEGTRQPNHHHDI